MAAPSTPDRLGSSPFWKSYATGGALGADANLKTDGGGPCRFIRVGQAGDLVLKMAFGETTETIYAVAVGEVIGVQATEIVASGTTAQKITVFW